MNLRNEFDVAVPVDRVWETLLDVERVGRFLPGAAVEAGEEEGTFNGSMKVKLGPMTVNYRGTAKLSDVDEERYSADIEVKAKEQKGQGTAAAVIHNMLVPEDGRTRVIVETDLQITGRQAQFGRGIMEDVANTMMGEFAKRLEAEIKSGGPSAEPAAAPQPAAEPDEDVSTWEGVRRQFALAPGKAHFTSFLLASHPLPVRRAIEEHREGLDGNPRDYLNEHELRLEEEVLGAAAEYLGAGPEEIALTDSTTMGLGLLYGGLTLREGQEIVTTEHDFYATHEALRFRAERSGAAVRRIRLYDEPEAASEDGIVSAIVEALRPGTRYLALTWVHSSTGVKLPLRAIADAVAEMNDGRDEGERVLLCVDGVHGFGVEDAAVAELGCDFFSSGCHKWLYGPRGTGVLWGRGEAWRVAAPIIPTFDGRSYIAWIEGRPPEDTPPGAVMTPGGFHSFEHRWALADAFAFHGRIGRARVAERTHALARQLKEGLEGAGRIRLKTPMDEALSAGLVCLEVEGADPREVVGRLDQQDIVASVTPYATQYVRLGPSIVNTPTEVDEVVAALGEL
jgi:selenocysteine lyase/cysteine desulfurase/carbon monoxide dehydrogenase subunit G